MKGPEPGTFIQYFKDDATAFNAEKKDVIDGKGVLNNRISEHIMSALNNIGVPTHFIRRLNMREQLIRQVEIVPLEVVVRNVAAGSLSKRLGIEEGTQLPRPIVEFFYKDDALGDPMVAEEHIIAFKLGDTAGSGRHDRAGAARQRFHDWPDDGRRHQTGRLQDRMRPRFGDGDFQRLIVADEISPDSCRLWDMETGPKAG